MKLSNAQIKLVGAASESDVDDMSLPYEQSKRRTTSALSPATKARLLELIRLLKQIHTRLAIEDRYKRQHDIPADTSNEKRTQPP